MAFESFPDLTGCSFDEFIAFLFARTVPSGEDSFAELARLGETRKWHPWYYDAEVSFDPLRLCSQYSRLFRNPRFLLDRFSMPQLDQGFWAVQSSTLECSAWSLVWYGIPLYPSSKGNSALDPCIFSFESYSSMSLWKTLCPCGGILFVTAGIVETGSVLGVARTWPCRTLCSRPCPRSSRLTLKFVSEQLYMA